MFGKRRACLAWPALALALMASGCAQPKYETANPPVGGGNLNGGSGEQKASACTVKFTRSGYCLAWKWESLPTSTEAGSLVFKVYRGNLYDDTPVEMDLTGAPELLLWMPSMGHGSSPVTVTRLDLGTYRATEVFFIMPGEWELRFQAKDGSLIQDEAIVSLTI